MAQVNSEPGVSQTPVTTVAPASIPQKGSSLERNTATLTTVSYSQTEPGANKPKRS
jgi:hypothetical protein